VNVIPVAMAVLAATTAPTTPSFNWEPIIIAGIAAIPATLAAFAAYRQARATHLAVNSRMEELLALARKEATAQATLDEKAAEHRRKGEAAVTTAANAASSGDLS